ncbi:MAG: DUF4215 domain-containing protein, partial [Deltaproteobacteria bacterium]|nr:DUF4215 domain-containing protein [Deltaproteobacteria bacterium]
MFRFSLVAVMATVIGAGCSESKTVQCENDGPVCPAGWECTVDQKHCIDPLTTTCGNGSTDQNLEDPSKSEECDDGNLENHDGCNWDCKLPKCGDGFKDDPEVCDDGNTVRGDGCSDTCNSEEVCGDRVKNDYAHLGEPAEECDEGGIDTPTCNKDCTTAMCGDGKTNEANNEECDGGGAAREPKETVDCNIDCTLAGCGDGKKNATRGEQCDRGLLCQDGTGGTKGENCEKDADCLGIGDGLCQTRDLQCCTRTCQNPNCGNGVFEPTCDGFPSEVCDDGKRCADGAPCTLANQCASVAGVDKECKARRGYGCREDCASAERCGDGITNDYPNPTSSNEACDKGMFCTDLTTPCTEKNAGEVCAT